mmetsp:Transcript_106878/g.312446  ORF Transcript_106878/g.312446 Transcript_106878/m.312446 type:complete len:496 (-) Transcript_106878:73-1560(-)
MARNTAARRPCLGACAAALASATAWGPERCHVQVLHARRCPRGRRAPPRHVARRQAARSGGAAPREFHLEQHLRDHRRAPFPVRVDGIWYDLAGWKRRHPAGVHFIEYYEGRDATEAIHAFHSRRARRLLDVLPRLSPAAAAEMDRAVPPASEVTQSFRSLRDGLEQEGWWDRDLWQEATWLCIWGALFFGGLVIAMIPVWGAYLSILPLTLAAVQGAWLGHDYAHGADGFCKSMRLFAPLAVGLSPSWWSDKHNNHHALTNQMGADLDLSMPPLYLWPPHPEDDSPLRQTQHYWFCLGCMSVFFSWRVRSLASAAEGVRRQRPGARSELAALLLHWVVLLLALPFPVICSFIALAGLICGTILTTSHLNEDLHIDFQHDWVSAQFRSTRGAVTRCGFTEWLWGGMQYHLEHHLFPTMPRSRYPQLAPILKDFALENGIPGGYRADDEVDMVARTWEHLRDVASQPGGGADAPRLFDHLRPTGIAYRSSGKSEGH